MITARIVTEVRTLEVECENNKDKAISALQESVKKLTKEDGRCKFVVFDGYTEVYSWFYQPTFREEKVKKQQVKKDPKYIAGSIVYILLNGNELLYENLFHDGTCFNTVSEARAYMKEHGYSTSEYRIVYEYCVSAFDGRCDYGFGLGFTREEAKENLNHNLSYYSLELKNGRVIEL